jgi:pyrroline-5-carboxylate reductase
MHYELGIIGAGNMAEAIVRGVLRAGLLTPSQVLVADPSADRLNLFRNDLGVRGTDDNAEIVAHSAIVLLSVKPQQMQPVLHGLKSVFKPDTLFISIAAGISTGYIEQSLGQEKQPRVIRAMPNTPMLVGQGMVAIAPGAHTQPADLDRAADLFRTAAAVMNVTEDQMDAVTAVSGSGPAYFFFLVQQMVAAGVEAGLSPEQAHELATRTALGAAHMLVDSKDSPELLRKKVTSPNGTTHAAITTMEFHGWPAITRQAVLAAADRSKELGL